MMLFSKVLSCMQLPSYLSLCGSVHYVQTHMPIGHTDSVHDLPTNNSTWATSIPLDGIPLLPAQQKSS